MKRSWVPRSRPFGERIAIDDGERCRESYRRALHRCPTSKPRQASWNTRSSDGGASSRRAPGAREHHGNGGERRAVYERCKGMVSSGVVGHHSGWRCVHARMVRAVGDGVCVGCVAETPVGADLTRTAALSVLRLRGRRQAVALPADPPGSRPTPVPVARVGVARSGFSPVQTAVIDLDVDIDPVEPASTRRRPGGRKRAAVGRHRRRRGAMLCRAGRLAGRATSVRACSCGRMAPIPVGPSCGCGDHGWGAHRRRRRSMSPLCPGTRTPWRASRASVIEDAAPEDLGRARRGVGRGSASLAVCWRSTGRWAMARRRCGTWSTR